MTKIEPKWPFWGDFGDFLRNYASICPKKALYRAWMLSTQRIETAAIKYEGCYWTMGAKSVKNWPKSSQNGRFWAILEFFLLNYVHPCNFILVQKCYLIWSNPSLFSVFRGTSTDKCGTGRGKPRATRAASHDQFHTSPRAVPRKKVKKKKREREKPNRAPKSFFS